MTTQSWSEHANGTWKLEIYFDNQEGETTGEFVEWILLLHGTKEAPYKNIQPLNANSKLAVAKSIHENNFKDKVKFFDVLTKDNQKRVGNSVEFEREVRNWNEKR